MKRTMLATAVTLGVVLTGSNAVMAAETAGPTNRFAGTAYPGAQAAATLLLQSDLNEREVQFLLGRLSQRHDDLETAVDVLEEAAERTPDNVTSLLRFGQASCMLAGHPETGMLSKAGLAGDCREALEKATTLDPKALSGWQTLFDFYRMAPSIVGGGLDKAEHAITKIAAIEPAEAEIARASLAIQQEKPAQVREHFAKAASLNPAKADEYRFREALSLMRVEDYPSAYELLKTLRASSADQAQIQYQFGRIAVLAKQPAWYGDAEHNLLAYLERTDLNDEHVNKPWAAFRLGQLYELMGKPDLAKARYLWAASQQPDDRLKDELKKKAIKV